MSDDQRLKHSIHSLSEQRKDTVISKQAVLIASKHLVLISISVSELYLPGDRF